MKTPNEARKCWCPFAQISNGIGHQGNRERILGENYIDPKPPMHGEEARLADLPARHFYDQPAGVYCIADECMAWRWDMDPDSDDTNGEVGYCGLAGKPS